ncbi:MAG: diadenylate cyclase CdaA [Bacteroidota bacterium]
MSLFLIKIGFLPVSLWDVLDVLIVGFLAYQLYRLLRGSIALNIFVGLALLFLTSLVVDLLGMVMLSRILNTFMSLGFIMLIIIFQPEVRRFLLLLGNSTLQQRNSVWNRLLGKEVTEGQISPQLSEVKRALLYMSRQKIGALVVCTQTAELDTVVNGGIALNAEISFSLLLSIFQRESPLHDGAVIIANRRIDRASAILPVSESTALPRSVGLRHRAAVGLSEQVDVACFIVSEETGKISFAHLGRLERKLSEERLTKLLEEIL